MWSRVKASPRPGGAHKAGSGQPLLAALSQPRPGAGEPREEGKEDGRPMPAAPSPPGLQRALAATPLGQEAGRGLSSAGPERAPLPVPRCARGGQRGAASTVLPARPSPAFQPWGRKGSGRRRGRGPRRRPRRWRRRCPAGPRRRR